MIVQPIDAGYLCGLSSYADSSGLGLLRVAAIDMIMIMQRGGQITGQYRVNRRRIGKKAMALSRTSLLLERKMNAAPKQRRKVAFIWRPTRVHYALFAGLVVFFMIGTAGYAYYQQQQAKERQAAAKVEEERARVASQKSDECRQQKVAAKADLIGKVTYDELYDYSVCDFSEE